MRENVYRMITNSSGGDHQPGQMKVTGLEGDRSNGNSLEPDVTVQRMFGGFCNLCHSILRHSRARLSRVQFLHEISKSLISFSGCDSVEWWLREEDDLLHCVMEDKGDPDLCCRIDHMNGAEGDKGHLEVFDQTGARKLYLDITDGHFDPDMPYFTAQGSFWTGGEDSQFKFKSRTDGRVHHIDIAFAAGYPSVVLIPLRRDGEDIGFFQLKSRINRHFSQEAVHFYELIARTIVVALANHRAQAALHERVKELNCLYQVVQLTEQPSVPLDEILRGVVELIPPAWQYPEVTMARITMGEHAFSAPDFQDLGERLRADILVSGESRGIVEVVYAEDKLELDEGPFLREERSLLDAIAKYIGLVIERRQAAKEEAKLQDQLRHADRLATIGLLGAGVAHELNEPLANILGFAQLIKKNPGLPEQALKDLEKIETASLHAREVIKKLLIFARQMPAEKAQVNINRVVNDGISFFEHRWKKEGISVLLDLEPDLPEIIADSAQLYQVLINLVMNSIQAMPTGGRLTLRTAVSEDQACLTVEDTGVGMTEDIKKQLFVPFFTTKDVDQGTGLGLAVVHGIVSSHGGTILVESKLGFGTVVAVKLPIVGLENK